MKTLINIMLIGAFAFSINAASAQNTKAEKKAAKQIAVKNKVDAVNYTFKADFLVPVRGTGRNLLINSYDLKITKDTITAYLPYFGRVYMKAPMSSTDAGLKFTSTDFEYKVTEKKKGGWLVVIKLKDTDKANQMIINISEQGSATLSTNSNYRDPITFYGDIATDKSI